jgi:DNA mismatch endonuclease (patch repair protein)
MSAIKNKDTTPEVIIRKALFKKGFRYRKNVKDLPGKPDILLPKYKAAIFVNGCFWHMHQCHLFKTPSTRREWWEKKLLKTKEKDRKNTNNLINNGWRVLIIWECSLKGKHKINHSDLISRITEWLKSQTSYTEISGEQHAG